LAADEPDEAGQPPEDVRVAVENKVAVKWVVQPLQGWVSVVIEVRRGDDFQVRQAAGKIEADEPPEKSGREATVTLVTSLEVEDPG
jgi:hypothetical protein